MFKEILDKIFSSRIFYVIFSIIVAFSLWIYVEISESETVNWPVSEIPITFINEDLLRGSNFIISSQSHESVSLTFIDSPRTLTSRLNRETVTLTVDLANITTTGYSYLPLEVGLPRGVSQRDFSAISRSTNTILLNIDRLYSTSIQVEARYTGSPEEGFIAGSVEVSPQSILIDGPETIVQQIIGVWVPIEQSRLSSTFSDNLPFILLDENGEELAPELREILTISQDTVRVTVPISVIREVPLRIDLVDGAGATAQNTVVNIVPPAITVSGDPEDMIDFNSITIGTIDLSSFAFTRTEMFPIALANNLINHSGETQALVEVEVVGLELLILSVPNPRVVNEPPGHTATIITQTHDVRVRGKPEDLEHVTESNIRVVADLADLPSGRHTVPARVYIDGVVGVGAVGSYTITVRIVTE